MWSAPGSQVRPRVACARVRDRRRVLRRARPLSRGGPPAVSGGPPAAGARRHPLAELRPRGLPGRRSGPAADRRPSDLRREAGPRCRVRRPPARLPGLDDRRLVRRAGRGDRGDGADAGIDRFAGVPRLLPQGLRRAGRAAPVRPDHAPRPRPSGASGHRRPGSSRAGGDTAGLASGRGGRQRAEDRRRPALRRRCSEGRGRGPAVGQRPRHIEAHPGQEGRAVHRS